MAGLEGCALVVHDPGGAVREVAHHPDLVVRARIASGWPSTDGIAFRGLLPTNRVASPVDGHPCGPATPSPSGPWRSCTRAGSAGHAATFLRQTEEGLGRCIQRGIQGVANPGGFDPAGLAEGGSLTVERLQALIPEARNLRVKRYMLPDILAVSCAVRGLLGGGAASSTRMGPQAETLAETARAQIVPVPAGLLD